jgi:hypothetical protein
MINTNKTNALSSAFYYTTGSIAILALLASGVFIAAPYVGALSAVTALGLGTPLIAVCAAFSVAVAIFSAIAISKNKLFLNKDAQLAEKNIQPSDKIREVADLSKTISEIEEVVKNTLGNNNDDDDAKHQTQEERQKRFDKLVAKRKQEEVSVPLAPIVLPYKGAEEGRESVNGTAAESAPNAQSVKSTKAAPKNKSGWSSSKVKAVGSLSALAYLGGGFNGLFGTVNDPTALANNNTGVGNLHNGTYPNPSFALPESPKCELNNKLNETENMLNAAQKKAAQGNWDVADPREGAFVTSQNDSTHGCTVTKGYANRMGPVLTPCSHGSYEVPSSSLKSVALCCSFVNNNSLN